MKKLSILLPILLVVASVTMAFALKSKNEVKRQNVYYRLVEGAGPGTENCALSEELEEAPNCLSDAEIDCVKPVPDIGNQPRTLYEDHICNDPFQEFETK